MRAVIQRVARAQVTVEAEIVGRIETGLLVLLGVGHDDTPPVADKMADKIAKLRIFRDAQDKMNLSVLDVGGSVLAVSQFTLLADARQGNRPSFTAAAGPEPAQALYERFCESLSARGVPTARGVFGAHMAVELLNDGPVTIVLDLP